LRRRGLTLTEVLVVLGVILLLVILFIAMYPQMRGNRGYSARRTVCIANLKGTGVGFATYAVGNNDCWPIPAHMLAEADEVGRVKYAPGVIGTKRGTAGEPDAGESTEQDAALSTTRVFWELIRSGMSSPKSFICPSSGDQYNDEDNPQDFWDFRKYSEVSYGYQVPFGKMGRPGPNVDQEMALVADKGPFSAALEAGKANPGVPKMTSKDAPDDWQPWNSPNHGGEGQNVLYSDTHVNWVMTPLAGWKKDNIYTRWPQADADQEKHELARVQGTPPTGIETPWGETDSLIYP
jgi:hypothetical protein